MLGSRRPTITHVAATVLTVWLAACGGSNPSDPGTGTLEIIVVADGVGVQGASVSANGPDGNLQGTTDATGSKIFANLTLGTYSVQLTGFPSNMQFSQTTQVANLNQSGTSTVTFTGTVVADAQIQGTVTVGGAAAAGVTVAISGPASAAITTDANGQYSFVNIPAGTYTVAISDFPSSANFGSTSKTVTVSAGGVATVDFSG